jgi:SH3 domain protein
MRLIIAVLILLPTLVAAETAYVTDSLRLGLHAAEDTGDRPFRFLDSGQEVEVLARDRDHANVRLPDGDEGWVKSAYLVDDKPAKLIVAETAAERDRVAAELEQLKLSSAEPAAMIDRLTAEKSALAVQLDGAESRISQLREKNASIEALRDQYRGSVPLKLVGGVIVVCLLAGFLVGLWWADFRSRRRHGGIRIY